MTTSGSLPYCAAMGGCVVMMSGPPTSKLVAASEGVRVSLVAGAPLSIAAQAESPKINAKAASRIVVSLVGATQAQPDVKITSLDAAPC